MTALVESERRYLSLLKKALAATLYEESAWALIASRSVLKNLVRRILALFSLRLLLYRPYDKRARENGADWPMFGFTMIGTKRLDNIEECIEKVLDDKIEGDFVECGVWRGGASILARAALDAYGGSDRIVWLADSFEGMPKRQTSDLTDLALDGVSYLAVSLEDVKSNFSKFDLLDDRVKFIKGWFADSLPKSSIEKISVLRLDADYYSSTMDALNELYDKVSPGGYIIVDDYHVFTSCKAAITDFLASRAASPSLIEIDGSAVYWQHQSA